MEQPKAPQNSSPLIYEDSHKKKRSPNWKKLRERTVARMIKKMKKTGKPSPLGFKYERKEDEK